MTATALHDGQGSRTDESRRGPERDAPFSVGLWGFGPWKRGSYDSPFLSPFGVSIAPVLGTNEQRTFWNHTMPAGCDPNGAMELSAVGMFCFNHHAAPAGCSKHSTICARA